MTHLFNSIKSIAISFGILTVTLNANAQWQQVSGLNGEPVYNIRSSTGKLFAMTSAGVLGSSNNGGNWAKIPALYLTNVVERISASGTTIVVYADPENYISTDDGSTWAELNPPAGGAFASDVIVENGIIYLGTYGDYIYKSIDNGQNWTQLTTGLTTSEINNLWAEGNRIYAATDDGVFASTNAGATFTFSGLAGEYVTRVYTKSPHVFAYCSSGIFHSGDDGATWSAFEPLIPYSDVTDFLVDGVKVYATTSGDLITSNVFAPTWTAVTFAQNINFNNSICKRGSSVFIGNNRGVYESTNNGVTWTERNTGIVPVNTVSLALLHNDTLFAGSSIYGISKNINSVWEFSGVPYLNANDLVTDGNYVYSGSEFGIHKSADGGNTWELINNTASNPVIAYCADIAIKDTLIIGASLQNGILRSGDSGLTWSTQNNGIAPSLVSSVGIIGSNLVAGTYDNGLFVSTDAGFTWTQTGAAGELINDITVIGNNVIAASNGPNGNYVSTDGGLSWNPVFSDYFDALSTSGIYVIASAPGYVALSMDSGFTYVNLTPAPVGTLIASSVASTNDVYVGTYYDGVWKISISEINAVAQIKNDELQSKIQPNIFNTATWLFVDEKLTSANSTLQITDLSGKLVYSQPIFESKTLLNLENLTNGIYIYKVINSRFETKAGKIVKQ